jgi:hypothetical protein
MNETVYQFRPAIYRGERTYRLTDDALAWSDGNSRESLPYASIRKIRLFASPTVVNLMLGGVVVPGFQSCAIYGRRSRAHVLSSNHFVRFGKFEDRSGAFAPFVASLVHRVAAANPETVFFSGMPIVVWTVWAALLILIILVLGLIVAVLMEVIPKGASEVVTVTFGVIMLVALIAGLPPLFRLLIREWPRRFDPHLGCRSDTPPHVPSDSTNHV